MTLFQNNRSLLDSFRRGDHDTLKQVYFHYIDAVAALVRYGFTLDQQSIYVPGALDSDTEHELIQEVFVRAYSESARQSYDGIRPYRPYLLRIAKNLLIDRLRQKQPLLVVHENVDGGSEGDLIDKEGAARAGEMEEKLYWQQLTVVTTEYVTGLSWELREFIRLRFEEECSQLEVAKLMKLSRRHVRTLEQRAQTGLRKHLKKLGLLNR